MVTTPLNELFSVIVMGSDRNLVVKVIEGIFHLGCHIALAGHYEPTRRSGKWDRRFAAIHKVPECHYLSSLEMSILSEALN